MTEFSFKKPINFVRGILMVSFFIFNRSLSFPMLAFTLGAFLTVLPHNASAQISGCLLNNELVPGDPVLIEGTSSADTIDCSTSFMPHEIYGYGGADTITGSNHGDFIAGGGGNDIIRGGFGNDAIDGGASDDDIYGGDGDDVIFGGVGSSPASGVGCELQTALVAAGSFYLVKGGSGDDTIHGGAGNDCIDAGSGEDEVYGGAGDDTIRGSNHADYLDGGEGRDHIDGGWHTDACVDGEILNSCEIEGDPDGGGDDGGGGGPDCVRKPNHWKCA